MVNKGPYLGRIVGFDNPTDDMPGFVDVVYMSFKGEFCASYFSNEEILFGEYAIDKFDGYNF